MLSHIPASVLDSYAENSHKVILYGRLERRGFSSKATLHAPNGKTLPVHISKYALSVAPTGSKVEAEGFLRFHKDDSPYLLAVRLDAR